MTAARIGAAVRRALGQSGPLILARAGSAALTFALPLVLVRLLEPAAFGTYKQFFLVAQTLLLVGQLGLTQSLFYFLPRGGRERGAYLSQALLFLLVVGAAAGLVAWTALPLLARGFGGAGDAGGLGTLRLPLALYAGGMLAAAPLEGALTSEGRIGGSAIAYLLTDATRASALIAGAVLGGARGLFWAAPLVAGARVVVVWALALRRVLPMARPSWRLLVAQLGFALPFAGASLLTVAQRQFSQYAVSASVPPAVFALFTVASFHMPVVDILFGPTTEVLTVDLGRVFAGGPGDGARLFREAVTRLAMLLFPATVGAFTFGPEVLPLLFTHRYAGAVPLFLLASIEIPLWILPLDAVLRAAGDRRMMILVGAGKVMTTGLLVVGGLRVAGLAGAIGGAIASEGAARVVLLLRARQLVGASLGSLFDRPRLGGTAAAALLAALPARAAHALVGRGGAAVGVGVAVYALVFFPLRGLLCRRLVRAAAPVPAAALS